MPVVPYATLKIMGYDPCPSLRPPPVILRAAQQAMATSCKQNGTSKPLMRLNSDQETQHVFLQTNPHHSSVCIVAPLSED
eukprot:23799-Eustigmatos_ZCMA.PRE.1